MTGELPKTTDIPSSTTPKVSIMNPLHSQVDSSSQLTSQQKAELEKMMEDFITKRGASSSSSFVIPLLAQTNTFIPFPSQGKVSTSLEKVFQEYLNTIGSPPEPSLMLIP